MSADISAAAAGKKKKIIAGDRKYVPILCTGYLKTWPLTQVLQLKILLLKYEYFLCEGWWNS